jgi:methylthioribose-1-phosphate isomerase
MKLELASLSLRLQNNKLEILDQRVLPFEEKWLNITCSEEMITAIQNLQVRGAPLIGVAAAFALAHESFLSVLERKPITTANLLLKAKALHEARPTAVNLMICMDRMIELLKTFSPQQNIGENEVQQLLSLAHKIYSEDVQLCEEIANNGAALVNDGDQILTHCNTGGLATAGVGTALGIIRRAHEQGKRIHVYVDETRPLLQGGKLTAWELGKLGIPYTLITDNMAGHLMSQNKITKAFVGADRIACNGDFANKIGTYSVAVLCHYHKIPFYVAAPYTTFDPKCSDGKQIPIEQRAASEVLGATGAFGTIHWAPTDAKVYNPAFDVTPANLVSGWVLDKKVFNLKEIQSGQLMKTRES